MFSLFDALWFDRAVFTFLVKPFLQLIADGFNPAGIIEPLVKLLLVAQGKGFVTDDTFESQSFKETYDFIVVGGGISGCTVASRLAVNHSVLLIHGPGGAASALSRIAFLPLFYLGLDERDFAFKSKPIENEYWEATKYTYSTGKDFGGTQTLSGGIWSYGKPGDFDQWRKLGIKKFDFDMIRRYGMRHEKVPRELRSDGRYRYGGDGEIHVNPHFIPKALKDYSDAFLSGAVRTTSTERIRDYNGDSLGFSIPLVAAERNGFVSSGARAFFEKGRPAKLDIALRSTVLRIVLEKRGSDVVATGVEWKRGRTLRRTNATKKIIISAGSIKTPQLLMLSGIGNRTVLEKLGVEPWVHRPGVGENFFDHSIIGNSYVCFPAKTYIDLSASSFINFLRDPEAPSLWKTPANLMAIGFFNSRLKNLTSCIDPKNVSTCRPDYELLLSTFGENSQLVLSSFAQSGGDPKAYAEDFFSTNKEDQTNFYPLRSFFDREWDMRYNQAECLMILPAMIHPESRGRIELQSKDIMDKPVAAYDPQSSKRDRAMMVDLQLQVQDIVKAAFGNSKFRGKFNTAVYKECARYSKNKTNPVFVDCMVRKYWKGSYHQAGTCRLGRRDDDMAVVDENFNVIGVSGLAVVDASVLPAPVSGHMLATLSALAEILAESLDLEARSSV